MPSDEIIETMARGMLHCDMPHVINAWNIVEEGHRADYRHRARAALSAAGWVMVQAMTMRERIARAIASNWVGELVWDAQTDEQHAVAFRMADAVLAVMAEPTAQMCEAGSALDSVPPITTSQADACYRAMLAAAGEPE